jgi:hypothetical protein
MPEHSQGVPGDGRSEITAQTIASRNAEGMRGMGGKPPKSEAVSDPTNGSGTHLVGDKPPVTRVWVREVWRPALGPSDDDVFDLS